MPPAVPGDWVSLPGDLSDRIRQKLVTSVRTSSRGFSPPLGHHLPMSSSSQANAFARFSESLIDRWNPTLAKTSQVDVTRDDDYGCVSWRIDNDDQRELFVERPGALYPYPNTLRIGLYFGDSPIPKQRADLVLSLLIRARGRLAALQLVPTHGTVNQRYADVAVEWTEQSLRRWTSVPHPKRHRPGSFSGRGIP